MSGIITSCRPVLRCTEREFVHLELIGDAPQRCLARDRNNPAVRQDRRAVIVLTVVEHHGQARTFVDADLQEEVLSPTLGV